MLRRPLLWAMLGSLVLHIPVLALVTNALLSNPVTPTVQLQVGILSGQQSERSELVTLPAPLATAVPTIAQQVADMIPVPENPVATSPASAATVSASAPALSTPSLTTPSLTTPSMAVSATASSVAAEPSPAVTQAAELIDTLAQTAPADYSVTQPDMTLPDEPAVSPPTASSVVSPVVSMNEQDIAQLRVATGNLLERLSDPAERDDLIAQIATQASLDPLSLGLLSTDVVEATFLPSVELTGLEQVDVEITRQIKGQPHRARIRLQERALSHYAKFINNWDTNVMLGDDQIDGRFHSNSDVNFESFVRPRSQFNGEVTIARRQTLTRRVRESSMFAAGVRTGTGRIALPDSAFPAHWLSSGAAVLTFDADTRLEFQGNAGVLWTDLDNGEQDRVQIPPAGLIIAGNGRAGFELSGEVEGRVVVYSPRRQMITGNLVYADASESSDDYLALVSDGSIEVAAAMITGPGDLTINAALFARDRFSVRRFSDRHQGELFVYGALVAGSVSATEPRFSTYIKHDPRFDHSRPPAFPGTGLFDVVDWEQHWAAVNELTDSEPSVNDLFVNDLFINAPFVNDSGAQPADAPDSAQLTRP
ncbi:hypothetical protein E3V39_11500 [Gammaproteobacteria bacterium LSUCC0112]|nr:hypothetical protein E3V39_11500 [Gammaproteobacteria bacterium LSUCC0112]